MGRIRTVISATGSYLPPVRVGNDAFLQHDFRTANGEPLGKTNEEIVAQFEAITGIKERRYVPDDLLTSDIAFAAAKEALDSSGIDGETLDGIIVAHNFGDVKSGGGHSDMVPALAAPWK